MEDSKLDTNDDKKVITVISEQPMPRKHMTEFHWGRRQVHALISKVEDFFEDFYDGTKKKKFVWNAVAERMREEGYNCTGSECDKKWRNLKGTYVKVLQKQIHGDTGYRFEYFDALHHILGKEIDPLGMREQAMNHGATSVPEVRTSLADYQEITIDEGFVWTDLAIRLLLDLILKHRDAFLSPPTSINDIWMEIAEQMVMQGQDVTYEQCQRKWVSLQDGLHLHQNEAEATGCVPLWPLYNKVKDIANAVNVITNIPVDHKPVFGGSRVPIHTRGSRVRGSGVRRAMRGSDQFGGREKDILGRVRQLETTYNISRRLERLESQVETAFIKRDAYKQTNDVLSQILSKLRQINNILEKEQQHFQPDSEAGQCITTHNQQDQASEWGSRSAC